MYAVTSNTEELRRGENIVGEEVALVGHNTPLAYRSPCDSSLSNLRRMQSLSSMAGEKGGLFTFGDCSIVDVSFPPAF